MDKNTIDFLNAKDEERMSFFLDTVRALSVESKRMDSCIEYPHTESVDDTFTVWAIRYDVSLPDYE